MDDEETMEGVFCYGVVIPTRQPADGPCAASITLLKARATAERVPALIEDLHRLPPAPAPPPRGPRPPRVPPVARSLPQSVDLLGGPAEDGRALVCGQTVGQCPRCVDDGRVGAREEADGPVGAVDQAARAERVQCAVGVGT